MDAWELFDSAMLDYPPPAATLLRALDAVDVEHSPGWELDRLELRGSIQAALASVGAFDLGVAEQSAKAASESGVGSWPNLHLAEACLERGEPLRALEALARVDHAWFDAEDLHWRSVQATCLAAEAHVLLGDKRAAGEEIRHLNDEYRHEEDLEFLESPKRLVRRLIASEWEDLLRELVAGLVLSDWLPSTLALEVQLRVGSVNAEGEKNVVHLEGRLDDDD